MLVCDELQIAFARIPHTATTSLAHALLHCDPEHTWIRPDVKVHRCKKLPKYQHYHWYVTVRDPFTRMYSEYCFNRYGKGWVQGPHNKKIQQSTFAEFVELVARKKPLAGLRRESMTQSQFIDQLKPDTVLRFEDLPECLYNLPWWPEGLELPHRNAQGGNSSHEYTEKERRLVVDWARDDFERFGYRKEIP